MIDWLPSPRVFVSIGGFTVYWYGLMYVIALTGVYFLFGRLQQYRQLALRRSQIVELITWGAVGVVGGGRLGYVLLYEPSYFMKHPVEIWQISQGGMSSHGGFIGVAVALGLYWATSQRKSGFSAYLSLLDILAVPAGLGLILGRLGNIINHELYITLAAQVVALTAPLLLAGVCWWALRSWKKPGQVIALFLIVYSLARFGEEYLREPEWPRVFAWLTLGQAYTVPLLLVGVCLFVYGLKDEPGSPHPAKK